MSGHITEKRQLETVDGPMDVFVSTPLDDNRGGVVVVQEAFGLTGHIQRVCEAVADAGYVAVAPALFHRSDDQLFGYSDYDKLGPVIMTMTRATIEVDVDAAFAELVRLKVPADKLAIVGFCFGGTVTLETAARLELAAAVTFYGGGLGEGRFGLSSGIESAAKLRTPWLGHPRRSIPKSFDFLTLTMGSIAMSVRHSMLKHRRLLGRARWSFSTIT